MIEGVKDEEEDVRFHSSQTRSIQCIFEDLADYILKEKKTCICNNYYFNVSSPHLINTNFNFTC